MQYFRDIERATRSLPNIGEFAWMAAVPGSQPAVSSFRVDPNGVPLRGVDFDVAPFTPRSVSQFEWPAKSGRAFGLADGDCRVAVVNTAAAAALFRDDTVGRVIYDAGGMPVEIIGVLSPRVASDAALYFNQTEARSTPAARTHLEHFTAQRAEKLERAELSTNVVSPNYFTAMGFRLAAGRLSPDPRSHACRVAVVNEEASDAYFAGRAIGAALIDELGRRTEIIGVVHARPIGPFLRHVEPTVYFPMAQDCAPTMTLMMAGRDTSAAKLRKVQSALDQVPGRGPGPVVVRTLETHLQQTALAPQHIAAVLIAACTAIALLLSVLGLYGALSDAARNRRRDLAIRIALGARRRDVIGHVLQEGAYVTAAGTIAGSLGAFVLTRLVPVPAHLNPLLWLAGPLLLALAIVIAGILPARRALIIDPVRILRGD
jgi:ABC-type antimicrobial peptide transport system permease subunit